MEFTPAIAMHYAESAMLFLIGTPTQLMAVAYMLLLLNLLSDLLHGRPRGRTRKRRKRKTSANFGEKLFAYTVFIILGNSLDLMMVNDLTGWEGSSQLLVCLDLVRREGKALLHTLETRYGISVPFLNIRFEGLGKEQVKSSEPNATIDQELEDIRKEIASIKEASATRGREG